MSRGWIGVALDGTLARYDHWRGEDHIGEPIPAMVGRVQGWIAEGEEVRIFTARASLHGRSVEQRHANVARIKAWCLEYIGRELDVTSDKDWNMKELWDDRAVQVAVNTGRAISEMRDARIRDSQPAALSAIDPEAIRQNKLHVIRRGLEIADAFCGRHTADECPDSVAIPIKEALSALAALSAVDPEAIKRECAEKICALDAKLPAMRRSSYQEGYGDALNDAEAAILDAEPARDDGKPEVGDLVISASSQAVQWNGLPDPWYWTVEDEVAMQDETIVVIMRAAEVKRRIEEATP